MNVLEIEIRPNQKAPWQRRALNGDVITIGRGRDNSLVVAMGSVSSKHAELRCEQGKWSIVDLGSANGTYLNGQRVTQRLRLLVGSEIGLGEGGPEIRVVEFVTAEDRMEMPDRGAVAEPKVVAKPAEPQLLKSTPPAVPASAKPPMIVAAPVKVVAGPTELLLPNGSPAQQPNIKTYAPSARQTSWMKPLLIVFVSLTVVLTGAVFFVLTTFLPARGHTTQGLLYGFLGTGLLVLVGAYSYRKRIGQEHVPGRLEGWLQLHVWLTFVGSWLILVHSGFHLDGGLGTFAFLALMALLLSGIYGWRIYQKLPDRAFRKVGNLASDHTNQEASQIQLQLEDLVAGRSTALKSWLVARKQGRKPTCNPEPHEHEIATEIDSLLSKLKALQQKWRVQKGYRFRMRSWLAIHIPAAMLFLILAPLHIYDGSEIKWAFKSPTPRDFASPETCAKCHESQYAEWITSMHAIAQSSPVTDLQNRLVVLKERKLLANNDLDQEIVGDLCVKCHAPTSRIGGSEAAKEDVLMAWEDREPAGMFGVSCVTCHQIDQIHPGDASSDEDKLAYKNIENLHWSPGKTMLGPIGSNDGELPSIGNAFHSGEFRQHFDDSSFCASCHTVVVDDPVSKRRVVKLQDTYSEWLAGGGKASSLNWSSMGVSCLDCHSRDLSGIAEEVKLMQRNRVALSDRLQRIKELLLAKRDEFVDEPLAATPADGFDLPLPKRRKHLHTFTGVDYHLEDNLPYPGNHDKAGKNKEIQAEAITQTKALLAIAAAIKIDQVSSNSVELSVLNLATGHHLPAGFAFARETWIEVSASTKSEGDLDSDWITLIGGSASGAPLRPNEQLNKKEIGLKNFQTVLWNGLTGGEAVLQNDAVAVLNGTDANAKGFADRQAVLLPGEIRKLQIPISDRQDLVRFQQAKRIRVRLLFRNYPPEFIGGLASKFELEYGDIKNAQRARALIDRLKIHLITEDILTVGDRVAFLESANAN